MVDEVISNWQYWNALNNGICHIIRHIPENKKDKEMKGLDNNPRAAETRNQWTAGLLKEGTLNSQRGNK